MYSFFIFQLLSYQCHLVQKYATHLSECHNNFLAKLPFFLKNGAQVLKRASITTFIIILPVYDLKMMDLLMPTEAAMIDLLIASTCMCGVFGTDSRSSLRFYVMDLFLISFLCKKRWILSACRRGCTRVLYFCKRRMCLSSFVNACPAGMHYKTWTSSA